MHIFECEYENQLKKNALLQQVAQDVFTRPKDRLQPKQAHLGGHTETYVMQFSLEDEEKKPPREQNRFHWLDLVSAYPFAAANTQYPIGEYTIFMGDTLTEQPVYDAESKTFLFQQKELIGVCQVRVIPPKNLLYPFLIYKAKDEKSYAPLCRTCTESRTARPCRHSDLQRSWVQCYTTLDLTYAAELGYKFIFFELYSYSRSAKIYADHMLNLGYQKLKFSGFPPTAKTQADKEAYCKEINDKMVGLPRPLIPEDISDNSGQRHLYKMMLNMTLGRIGLKQDHLTNVVYAKTRDEVKH
jgi:hypothetical protein